MQPGNANRDLLKALLKNKPWPPVYWADIPIHDPGTGEDRQASLPFMLPHEILAVMVEGRLGDSTQLVPEAGIHPELRHHVSELAKEMGVDPCTLTPCGLHGDGVPFGASGDSLEQVSINFLCLPEDGPAPRVPVAMVQKRFVKKAFHFRSSGMSWHGHSECWVWGSFLPDGMTWGHGLLPMATAGKEVASPCQQEAVCVKCEGTGPFSNRPSIFQHGTQNPVFAGNVVVDPKTSATPACRHRGEPKG
jgi:hypothetical protein